jgi:hypothetical protein
MLFAQGFLAFNPAESQLIICVVYHLGQNSLLLYPVPIFIAYATYFLYQDCYLYTQYIQYFGAYSCVGFSEGNKV